MAASKNSKKLVIFLTAIAATRKANGFTQSSTAGIQGPRLSFSSSSSILKMAKSLEALAKEGPWTAYLDDETTGLVYYFNSENGESSWDPPTATFPDIKMSKQQEKEIEAKRQDYNENRIGFEEATEINSSANQVDAGSGGGIFGNLFAPKAKVEPIVLEEEPVVEEVEEEPPAAKPSLFGGFFGTNDATDTSDYDQSLFEDAVAVEEYDQSFFEDAVAVEDGESGVAKKSFVDDIMAFASFPTTTKKEEEVDTKPETLSIDVASKIMPHPEKVSWGGEDALFVSGRSFGVFDGVSGAEKLDGVPLYSNTLANQLKKDVGQGGLSVDELKKKLLSAAEYADMSATGASTAVIASIGDDDVLRSLCLGDSVLMVIRNGSVFAKTKETLHYFDCPYQLSEESPDRPRDGTVMTTKLLPGDFVVSGSDGVFDNLDDKTIIELVTDESVKSKPNLIAQKIITKSRIVSKDTKAPTPYAKQAKRNRYDNYQSGLGGKIDDISCIVVGIGAQ